MRRALALLALSVALLAPPVANAAAPPTLLAQTSTQPRIPTPPEPTPGAAPKPAPTKATPRAATPTQVEEDSPDWVLPAVIAVAALAVLIALLSLTPLDPARALTPLGRRASEAGSRTSEVFASLWDRVRITR